jgi:hypothetical protein
MVDVVIVFKSSNITVRRVGHDIVITIIDNMGNQISTELSLPQATILADALNKAGRDS